MFKALLKKQLTEFFRSYYYNPKKNEARSRASTIAYFAFFFVIMVGMLGGIFTYLSLQMRGMLVSGFGWFYYLLMGLIALVLGVFGSVFNTYASLYLAKDNDLLLSLPIPTDIIISVRLVSVYLMGLMYSGTVTIPAAVVALCTVPFSVLTIVGAVVWILTLSLLILALSCLLGYAVARASVRMKNRSFATVLTALVGIGLYYFVYFKALDLVRDLIGNVESYGEQIRSNAYPLYVAGRMGEGDPASMAICLGVILLVCALVWLLLRGSFLKLAAASGTVSAGKRGGYKEARPRSASRALLSKEFARFTGSANYMLNCGLGLVIMVLIGGMLLIRGDLIVSVTDSLLGAMPGSVAVVVCALVCMIASMNDMAAPSVSLEGKSLWIVRTLPVTSWQILRAKLLLQLIPCALSTLLLDVCAIIALGLSAGEAALVVLLTLSFTVLSAALNLFLGLTKANLTWSSESYPLKQSASVTIALFSGWIYAGIMAALYFVLLWKHIGALPYIGIFTAVTAAAAILLGLWLKRRGPAVLEAL